MSYLRNIVHRVGAYLVRIADKSEQMHTDSSAAQSQLLNALEAQGEPSIHSMEVDQQNLVQGEVDRRSSMNTIDLRSDLEDQYGKSKWAKKVIDGMLTTRVTLVFRRLGLLKFKELKAEPCSTVQV